MKPSGSGPHTWDDFIALDDDDPRELIDGWLVDIEDTEVHPSTAPGPDEIRACCARSLRAWLGAAHASRLRADVTLGDGCETTHATDIVLFSEPGDALAITLTIDVIPARHRQHSLAKRDIYRTASVAECWFIEPETAILERYTLVPERGTCLIRPIAADTNLQPEGFPGLEIPLAELWTTER